MTEFKPTNPKDLCATTRLPLNLVPDTLAAYASLAFLEGALKYGAMNWRVAGVSASIYIAAAERHLTKWKGGEWADPKTRVPHLASAIACLGIILDADLVGKLNDDRPPAAPMAALLDEFEDNVAHLQGMFSDRNPRHCTIADTPSALPHATPAAAESGLTVDDVAQLVAFARATPGQDGFTRAGVNPSPKFSPMVSAEDLALAMKAPPGPPPPKLRI